VPVPRTFHLGDAGSPLGAPFYAMERVVGHICRNSIPAGYALTPDDRRRVGEALVDVLADLHKVDPGAVGLAEFGRPAGFMERQLLRWYQQWVESKTADLPALDALRDELVAPRPEQQTSAIVHGDYRLDNTIPHRTEVGRSSRCSTGR
jgi:aminoglycoside phosphotransferase (APT) family kinase protein